MSEPEARHRARWYGRRTGEIPPDIGFRTIEDGEHQFDVRNCENCDYLKAIRPVPAAPGG